MSLKTLAKSHNLFEGAAVVWMLPTPTVRSNIATSNVRKLFGMDDDLEWTKKLYDAQLVFLWIEGHMVDVDIVDTENESAKALQVYWSNRKGTDIANNWLWYENTMTEQIVGELFWAYVKTRRDYVPISDKGVLADPMPDYEKDQKKTGSGRKRMTKK